MTTRDLFFKDISDSIAFWTSHMFGLVFDGTEEHDFFESRDQERVTRLRGALQHSQIHADDFRWLLRYLLVVSVFDVLTIIDGATKMAETTVVKLVDDNGDDVGEGLHEHLFTYLDKHGV